MPSRNPALPVRKPALDALTAEIGAAVGKIKLPLTDAGKADLRYTLNKQRLALQKQVEQLQALETQLNDWFIENLPKSEASGIAGKVARIQLQRKVVPQVEDWEKVYGYIQKHGAFELLQRRINNAAVAERWDNKEQVPGVGNFTVITVSCTKL